VTAGTPDPDHTNNQASTQTTVNPAPSSADVSVTKSDAPDPVEAGSPLTYGLVVHNAGPDTATGVSLSDPLPAGVGFVSAQASQGSCGGTTTVTCDLGTLAAGAEATVAIVVTPTGAGTVTNTATVTAGT